MSELIQFDGRTVAVIAPEDLEELEAKIERLRGLLRRWMDQRMSPWPPSGELVSLINATSVALGAADQPPDVQPCAECGEPTTVWDLWDDNRLCHKCIA